MRIGLIIYGTLDILTGGYLYDRYLVEHLEQQGDEVVLISLPWRNYVRHLTDNFSPALFRHLRDLQLDVLIQDELNHPSLILLNRRLKRVVDYPIVSLVHLLRCSDSYPAWQNHLYRWVEQRYLMTLDGFIYNSETTAAVAHQLVGQSRPYVVAYPAGNRFNVKVDAATITARAQQNGPLRLLFVANLIARKGLHLLLAALKHLPSGKWHLDVVGREDMEPAYVRRVKGEAQRAKFSQQVTWHGALLGGALAERFAESHLLVVPSSYEGFGIVYLEGMAFGLPAIATTAGAAHEIITHAENGFLVPPEQPALLAEQIRTLLADRQLLEQMSLAARKKYQNHPTWAESMAKIRQFLLDITS